MATLRDLADELGLSMATVSRALNGHPNINERTRQRVQQSANKHNYQPNALARALRQNQTKIVGLVIPDTLNRFYAAGAAVLQATLEQYGYRLIICINKGDPGTDRECLNALLQQRVDGIVHVPCAPEGARLVRDSGSSIPIVELNRCSDGGLFDAVIPDDREGTLQLTRHLLDLGHRRIGMIVGPQMMSTTRARVSGFHEAFREAGVPFEERWIGYRVYSEDWGEECTREFLAVDQPPTAILAAGNQLVLGALRTLTEYDVCVPDEISLAGIDDPGWFSVWKPGITTYALPLQEMGLLAAQLLLSRMSAPQSRSAMPTVTRLSGQLKIRGSTGPPKASRPVRAGREQRA